jgi:hypothetical protein
MAPGILLSSRTEDGSDTRPSKRIKTKNAYDEPEESGDRGIPSHPLQVKPSGNAFSSSINFKNNAGYFGVLPDELILQLFEQLSALELLRLGSACRFLYAFTQSDEIWRALFVE